MIGSFVPPRLAFAAGFAGASRCEAMVLDDCLAKSEEDEEDVTRESVRRFDEGGSGADIVVMAFLMGSATAATLCWTFPSDGGGGAAPSEDRFRRVAASSLVVVPTDV